MINTEVNLIINDDKWSTELPDIDNTISHIISLAVNFVNTNEPLEFFALNKTLSFNVCLSNDDEVHSLNYEFRKQDKPTNVLSFANIDDEEFASFIQNDEIIEMGDIIIAIETMQKEASEKKISLHNHFCHLLTHGTLHLLGYDHIDDNEAEHMESFEIKILNSLNIENPYNEDIK